MSGSRPADRASGIEDDGRGADPDLDDLLALLAEAEERVERLRAELDDRRRGRDQQSPSHPLPEGERFVDYLEQATVNWQAVREFLRQAIEENRRLEQPREGR